jgi:lambda family phage portal protein
MILDAYGKPMRPRSGGYDGAVDSRHRQRHAHTRSLPYDEDNLVGTYSLDAIRRECLDLRRNNAIVAGVVERFADHVVGPGGITPQAKTSDPDWNDEAEAYWSEWSKIADYRQRVNLRELQRLAVQSRLLLGDCGFVLLANGQIQPIEALRIKDPNKDKPENCIHGVKLSASGIPLAFYVHARNKSGAITGDDFEVVKREDFVFVSRPMRMDQVRGIPELAPIMNAVADFGTLQANTLSKSIMDSMHAWAVYSDEGAAKISQLGARVYGDDGTAEAPAQKFETFGPNQTYYMRPGEKVESLSSDTPNPQYVQYSEMLLRIIASALSLPYEFLVLDFKQGSFSASRAALMTTYRTFAMWQGWIIDGFMQRLWNWRIAKAIKAGDLRPAPVDKRGYSEWYRVRWATPSYEWLDPKSESISQRNNYQLGIETITSICHSKGRDAEDVLREKAGDIASADRIAKEINAAQGTNLTWRDLIEVGNASMVNATNGKPPAPTTPEDDEGEPADET